MKCKLQKQVADFHSAFDMHTAPFPQIPDEKTVRLRLDLIDEELEELELVFGENDLVGVADAIGDLLYVVYGAAEACGIDMDPITDEIHRSNMTKRGGHKAENGKWIKPATYEPADLLPILAVQITEGKANATLS